MSNHETKIATFRKSSFSESGNCVEVASENGSVMVRDSKRHDGEMVIFLATAWREFTRAVYLNMHI